MQMRINMMAKNYMKVGIINIKGEIKMSEYIAMKYKGKEWGLYGKKSNCFIVFGTEKEIKERAKKLNSK